MKWFFQACLLFIAVLFFQVGCKKETKPSKEHPPQKNVNLTRRLLLGGLENTPSKPRRKEKWEQFRGPGGTATLSEDLPIIWQNKNGVEWCSELPGRGASSPIAYGKYVFVTAASGYGTSAKDPGKIDNLRHHLLCIDSGGVYQWQRDIKGTGLTQKLNEEVLRHGFASSTPATDGELVYAFFGASGVFAFNFEGKLVWQADVGLRTDQFGSSASLLLYEDLLIVNASVESKSVFAIDKKSGKGVWRIEDIDRSWAMPVIGKNSDGIDELIINEEDFVRGFDPLTGKQLWFCEGVNNYVVATPVIHGGICYCNGGIEKQLMAIKLGGSGNVTETHKLWEVPMGANVSSPVYLTGRLFLISDSGFLQVFDARTGDLVKKHRLPTKSRFYSSPLLAGNAIFCLLEDGGLYVCEANEDAKKLAHNKFTKTGESLKSSVSVYGNRLLIRSDKRLYMLESENLNYFDRSLSEMDFDAQLIEPKVRYEFNEMTKRPRLYNLYLDPIQEICKRIILAPYKSVITDTQTEAAVKLIKNQYGIFEELKQQQRDAYWEFLKSGSEDREALDSRLLQIEKETEAHANKIRVDVKKLFSKEQMGQHLAEAAERKAAAKKAADAKRAAERKKKANASK